MNVGIVEAKFQRVIRSQSEIIISPVIVSFIHDVPSITLAGWIDPGVNCELGQVKRCICWNRNMIRGVAIEAESGSDFAAGETYAALQRAIVVIDNIIGTSFGW